MEDDRTPGPPAPEGRHGSFGFFRFLGFCLLFLLLYFLSAGPALEFIDYHPGLDFSIVYQTLAWLQNHSHFCDRVFNWYIHSVWGVGVPR
jgi:hypothetical protein